MERTRGILEAGVRGEAGHRGTGIPAFDQDRFIGRQVGTIVPLLRRVTGDPIGFTRMVRGDLPCRDQVVGIEAACITQCQRPVARRLSDSIGKARAGRAKRPQNRRVRRSPALPRGYVDLHRHAAVRARLASEPGVALRVAVAHVIAGSSLWTVRVQQQRAKSDAVTESVESCASEASFDAHRRKILAVLDFDPDTRTVTGGACDLAAFFTALAALDDAQVVAQIAALEGKGRLRRGEGSLGFPGATYGARSFFDRAQMVLSH